MQLLSIKEFNNFKNNWNSLRNILTHRLVMSIFFLVLANMIFSQVIEVTKVDSLIKDVNNNMKADPGDSLRYTTKIIISGANANNVTFDTIDFDPNLTINPNYHISPLARQDNYTCTGNVGIDVPVGSGLLVNDIDLDNNLASGMKITLAGSTTTNTVPGTQFTTLGGAKVTVNVDGLGAFSYNPAVGFSGNDSFVYELTDGDPLTPNRTTKVNITVSGIMWFVDKSAGVGGDGTWASRFDALSDVSGVTGPDLDGQIIYIFTGGAGNYTGGMVLRNNQQLIGQGSSALPGITLAPHSNIVPLNGTDPVIFNTAGDGITLASGNTIRGLNIGACSDFGIDDNGTVGTLSISEVDITNSTGGGFRTDGGGTLAVSLGSLTSTSGSNGVNLGNVSGSCVVTGTTSINNSTSPAVNLSSISGTSVTFNALNITNTATNQIGVFANSGTINSTSGTINVGSARAIDINNATLGMTLTSVTSNGGTAPGIDLATTTGNFTVTGDDGGSNNGSGGSCSNKTGNIDGVILNNVTNVSLNYMNINSNSRNGVFGTNVNGITMNRCNLNNNTDQDNPNENALDFDGLTGSDTLGMNPTIFNNLIVTNSHEHNVEIRNSSGLLSRLLIKNSTFSNDGSSSVAGTNLNFLSQGTADMTLHVRSSEFIGNRVAGALTASGVFADGQSTATLDVTVKSSFFEDNNNAINISHSGSGNVTFDISNNGTAAKPIVGNLSAAEAMGAGGASTAINILMSEPSTSNATGKVNNNFIGKAGVTESGSATGRGIVADIEGTGDLRIEVHGNTIRETDSNGIRTWAQNPECVPPPACTPNPGGRLFAKVTNNTLDQITSTGIYVRIRDESSSLCAKVEGNNVTNTTGTHVRVREDSGAATLEQGLSVSANSTTVLTNNNPGASTWDGDDPDVAVVSNGNCGTFLLTTHFPESRIKSIDLNLSTVLTFADRVLSFQHSKTFSNLTKKQLGDIDFNIDELSDLKLASTFISEIIIDKNAAGHGWFIDPTPLHNEEFTLQPNGSWKVIPGSLAEGKIDLLTVLLHELEHVLGKVHNPDDPLMQETLSPGVRKFPNILKLSGNEK